MELPFVTAMTIGFLGSTHCVGMCGGILGALNAPSEQSERHKGWASALHHISYNGGRIVSYVFAGALGGLIGAQVGRIPLDTVVPVGGVVAAMVMVALGFYIGGWWRAIAELETLGQFIWRKIQPLGQRFLPVRNSKHAFGLGLVWGWLPCGLVYSALTLAVVSGAPGPGAAIMFGFGLGTLPMLLVMGGAAGHLKTIMQHGKIRQVAGVLVICFGIYSGYAVGTGSHHTHVANHDVSMPAEKHSSLEIALSLVFGEICWAPSHRRN